MVLLICCATAAGCGGGSPPGRTIGQRLMAAFFATDVDAGRWTRRTLADAGMSVESPVPLSLTRETVPAEQAAVVARILSYRYSAYDFEAVVLDVDLRAGYTMELEAAARGALETVRKRTGGQAEATSEPAWMAGYGGVALTGTLTGAGAIKNFRMVGIMEGSQFRFAAAIWLADDPNLREAALRLLGSVKTE